MRGIINTITVVPLYVATLTRGHPSYKAMIFRDRVEFNIPLTRGHPSNEARFLIPQGWPYKRGTTVYRVCSLKSWPYKRGGLW